MINLNDEQFEVKEGGNAVIFNKGKAGLVKGCTGKVVKKTAADPDNSPDYKVYVIDEDGGEVNYGLFKGIKDSQLNFKGKELKAIAKTFGYECVMQGSDYGDLLDKNMPLLKSAIEGKKFDVVVTYGTKKSPNNPNDVDRPKRFLQIENLMDIRTDGNDYINPRYIMVRPEADDVPRNAAGEGVVKGEDAGDDLPW